MNIWVDDIRTPPDDTWVWCKTSSEALWLLGVEKHVCDLFGEVFGDYEPIAVMSLDHDLGGLDTTRPIVLWCCEHNFWPNEVRCHSSNPPGREWIEGMIERYKI